MDGSRYRGQAPQAGGREELAGKEIRGAGPRSLGISRCFFRGGGCTLTGESFDGLHRPVFVGAVHEGIAGLDQELAAVGDLVLRKHFLQVRGGHALVEIADVQLVHGGGLGQDAVLGKAERAGAGGEPPRPRREAAAADANFLCTPPLKLSGAEEGKAAGGRAEVAGEFGEAQEKCPRRAGRRTTRRGSFPSVRNPSKRAGVSRFSAAALAPPLNKIDLKKKNGAEKKKKKAKPRGESPHPPCRGRPPTPLGPWALQHGPAHQTPGRGRGEGASQLTPRVSWAGGGCFPEALLAPSPLQESGP